MKLRDPDEICKRLFKLGATKTRVNTSAIIEGIEYLLDQDQIDWVEYDTDQPTVLHINPKSGFELNVIAEIACWRPDTLNWECRTEAGDFTVADPIRSARDMRRPVDNIKELEAKYAARKSEESEGDDNAALEAIQRDGLFVSLGWKS